MKSFEERQNCSTYVHAILYYTFLSFFFFSPANFFFFFLLLFVQDIQDEIVSLNLQFNMSEDRAKKLERENKDLVDRWMKRMGQEADAMNRASRFS